ncbi:hypothetical protein P153DRAFT_369469 [Dothidotthia symphoricarpi CBS 119687]|uniref:Uncharacterized protein n=1 Tax=Dothidotthia symphoricarpi CBS 119687 TaxID=1392245 RepID=A0A6A6A4R4_9PLEO|nr:uncharacterized protein P153DRAFT_369469 [Dothidotthia symphoricarpi CBS 119687]KAF2126114.1 hypothetical protein P153DRAFT_369469 [Dothidotthia symphoricarpi CBS 119687]
MCYHEYTTFALCSCKAIHSRPCTKCDDPLMIIYCPDYRVLETQDYGTCEKHHIGTPGCTLQRLDEQPSEHDQCIRRTLEDWSELPDSAIQNSLLRSPSVAEKTNSDRTSIYQTVPGAEQDVRSGKNRDEAVIVKYNPKTREFERPMKRRRNGDGALGA